MERRGGQRRAALPPGVRVAIGGDGAVTVTVPAELREQLCGICAHPENGAGKCGEWGYGVGLWGHGVGLWGEELGYGVMGWDYGVGL